VRGTAAVILKQVKSLGYATSVHRRGWVVVMQAIPLSEPDPLVLVRDGDGDDDAARSPLRVRAGSRYTHSNAGRARSRRGHFAFNDDRRRQGAWRNMS
jgi:hypothetical protein